MVIEVVAVERLDLVVGYVGDHCAQFRFGVEEVFVHVGAVVRLVGLVVVVECFVYAC